MFDRGLISINDDYSLLLAQSYDPTEFPNLINQERCLKLPELEQHYPHPQFLNYHRNEIFKG